MLKNIRRLLLQGGLMKKSKNRINDKILKFINNSDEYDENTKDFLIKCLNMEFFRDKTGSKQYFKDYDKIVDKYVGD